MPSSAGVLSSGADPFHEAKAAHIIDDIGQFDLHCGSSNADCSGEQSRLRLLISKECSTREWITDFPASISEYFPFPSSRSLIFHAGRTTEQKVPRIPQTDSAFEQS